MALSDLHASLKKKRNWVLNQGSRETPKHTAQPLCAGQALTCSSLANTKHHNYLPIDKKLIFWRDQMIYFVTQYDKPVTGRSGKWYSKSHTCHSQAQDSAVATCPDLLILWASDHFGCPGIRGWVTELLEGTGRPLAWGQTCSNPHPEWWGPILCNTFQTLPNFANFHLVWGGTCFAFLLNSPLIMVSDLQHLFGIPTL